MGRGHVSREHQLCIKFLSSQGYTLRELMSISKRSESTIRRVLREGNVSHGQNLTEEEKLNIIRLRKEGKSLRNIAAIMGRSLTAVKRVINKYEASQSIQDI